jgi:hypothetical protein
MWLTVSASTPRRVASDPGGQDLAMLLAGPLIAPHRFQVHPHIAFGQNLQPFHQLEGDVPARTHQRQVEGAVEADMVAVGLGQLGFERGQRLFGRRVVRWRGPQAGLGDRAGLELQSQGETSLASSVDRSRTT